MHSSKPKFLFIRFSSIGDIILTTPLLRVLKSTIPDAEIHYLTKSSFNDVIKHNPYLHKVHLYNGNFAQMIKSLNQESFDYIIDLHNNARTLRVKNNLKRMSFTFNKLNFKKWLYVNLKYNIMPDVHIVERYFETLQAFDIKSDGKGLNYFFNEDEIDKTIVDFELKNKAYISFAIGANHSTKKLPNEKIIELCEKLSLPVVLLGDKNDFTKGEIIRKEAKAEIVNACGKYSLNQSAFLLKHSKLVITHDTGLMHMAAALHKKTISVWGNTVPEFGMYPYMPERPDHFSIVEVRDLRCRPCSKIGYEKCPKKHFKCMNDINIDEIETAHQ